MTDLKAIGTIALLVIGIIIFAGSYDINSIQTNNLQICSLYTSEDMSQSLGQQNAEICQRAPVYQYISIIGILLGGSLTSIGAVLVLVVAIRKRRRNKQEKPLAGQKARGTNKIYCRYCGKLKPIEGKFCSLCGRSSKTSSTTMTKCLDCDLPMSEDSEFCANCGAKIQKTRS
jgi:hypothetical protein